MIHKRQIRPKLFSLHFQLIEIIYINIEIVRKKERKHELVRFNNINATRIWRTRLLSAYVIIIQSFSLLTLYMYMIVIYLLRRIVSSLRSCWKIIQWDDLNQFDADLIMTCFIFQGYSFLSKKNSSINRSVQRWVLYVVKWIEDRLSKKYELYLGKSILYLSHIIKINEWFTNICLV